MSDPSELEVTGGRGGITAHYQDMLAYADLIDQSAHNLLELAADCHQVLVNPDLLASAALNPDGFAQVEAALLNALDGPQGLATTAARLATRAIAIRAAVCTYQAADQLVADLTTFRQYLQGHLGVLALPWLAAAGTGVTVTADNPAAFWQRLLTEHPGIVDETVGSLPGFLSALSLDQAALPFAFATGETLNPATIPQGAGMLGVFYPDGHPAVRDLGVDTIEPSMTTPPRGFADLMKGLNFRNNEARGASQGQIDVRVVEEDLPGGGVRRSFIVDVPGTKDWQFDPTADRRFLNDLGTNLAALGNETSSYERGIAEALRQAGATPGDQVMLVGHSQGGMVAVQAARRFTQAGTFNVTHVVTAGSPVGQMPVPDRVQVLSLENAHDIVPHLDARPNPDRPNRVTVTFDTQHGTIGDNHSINLSYVGGASAVDESADPSVAAYRDGAAGFFTGDRVESHVYQVTREQQ